MKVFITFLTLVFFTFTGCGGTQPDISDKNARPSWILNPNQNGKSGAIGVAGRTYDQKISTQRKLAISRALDELSLQQGVRVEMDMVKKDVVTNERSSTSMRSDSSYKTSSKITAHIEKAWRDPISGEFYVWMVLD
jgi:hypothetical protein